MVLGERRAVHPKVRTFGRQDVVDQDVRSFEQFIEARAVDGVPEIKRKSVFVGVEVQKESALFRIKLILEKWAASPDEIALRGFDL